jgi:hypothetical protein
MKRFVLAPLAAALAMFVWGFLYYGISGLPYRTLQPAAGLAHLGSLPADGTYLLPDPALGEAEAAAAMAKGPIATVHYRAVPRPMGQTMALGYLHGFVCCLVLSLLLWRTRAAIDSFRCRVMFSLMVGVLATVFANLGAVVWWQHDWPWALATMAYDAVAFLIAGLVLAPFHAGRAG